MVEVRLLNENFINFIVLFLQLEASVDAFVFREQA